MQKGKDEDEMLDQTLKAIEIDVHIADIAVEKERLTSINKNLLSKQTDLEKQVDELDDPRRRKGRVGAAVSPRPGKAAAKDAGNPDQPAQSKKDGGGRASAAAAVVPEQAGVAKKGADKSRSSSLMSDD